MDFSYLISSIFAESTGKTFDKLNYRRNKIDPRHALFIVFIIMTLCVAAYTYITKQPFPQITVPVGLVLLGIIAFSLLGNIFDELSLQKNDLSLREPLVDFEPIAAGLIAYLLFPEERNPVLLISFILAAFVVYWGVHQPHLRKAQTRGLLFLLIAVLAYAVVPIFYKAALEYLSPEYIALFRLLCITLLLPIFFRPPKRKKLTGKMLGYSTLAGIAYAIGAVTSLYAIQAYGLVLTMLFLMLGPALNYLSGYFILHEKVRRSELVASLMLTLIVAVAAFAR